MTNEETKTLDITKYPGESELFERIKNIPMATMFRDYGCPKYVSKDIIYNKDEKGKPTDEIIGLMYSINPTNRNINMTDPVTGFPTDFKYFIYADCSEDAFIDACPIGCSPKYHTPNGEKVKFQGLVKIIKEINPDSKII